MTNPARYPTDGPEDRPDPSPSGGQPYPGAQTHVPSHLRYDWRAAQQPSGFAYDSYHSAHQAVTAPIPRIRPKNSRRGALVAGAVAAAVVGGGIGAAAVGIAGRANDTAPTKAPVAQAPAAPHPAAKQPAGSVEQVAAKVMPSVVKLKIDMGGGQGDEGSGIVLSADGLILTNNHVVAPAAGGDQGAGLPADSTGGGGATETVTFSNGQTAPFTVVGTDPTGDLAVVRAQGVSGLTPITIGSSKDVKVGQQVVASARRWVCRGP